VIAFDDVSHEYAHAVAVRDVSLRVGDGVTTALIGPSGCGKSTVLKLIAGLEWPQRGRITVNGEAVSPSNIQRIRHRIGYVIQSGGLFPHMTARDNVTLAARYLKRDQAWIDARVTELVELVQLSDEVLARYPGDLSGGQRQRVSLMRALMLDPDLLLLDEPLGALDPMVRHDLQGDLRALFARLKKSVLLVTHDLAEAAFFAETIVLMREGRIVQQGSYRSLIDAPADEFVRAFLRAQRALTTLATHA
jgi:osmoprotectant transport system ATP-binding protein